MPLPLCKLYEKIRDVGIDSKQKWYQMLKGEDELLVLKKLFRKRFNKPDRSHIKLINQFLLSKDYFPMIEGSVVEKEVHKISKKFTFGRRHFRLRNSYPRREMNQFKDCFASDHEISGLIYRVLKIFELDIEIGRSNTKILHDWVIDKVLLKPMHKIPQFKASEVKFLTAFRAKTMFEGLHRNEKNVFRLDIFNNFMHALFWFTLAAIRECLIPILSNEARFVWRCGYLKFLKIEMKDFRRRYRLRRVKPKSVVSRIGSLQMRMVHEKLRPLFPKNYNIWEKRANKEHWRLLLSRLRFVMEYNGIQFPHIRQSCQKIRKFLNLHRSETVHGFTADITKCFSNVDHRLLFASLKGLVENIEDKPLYSVVGVGNNKSGNLKTFCCTAFSEEEAKEKLKLKLAKLSRTERTDSKRTTVKEMYKTICEKIKHYEFKHSKSMWRVTHGVPQGHPLSALLASLYLESFQLIYWKQIVERAGDKLMYSRYVDDFIFCTTEKSIVDEMLAPLYSGDNFYKLETNKEKEQYSTRRIRWCGVTINLEKNSFKRRKRMTNGRIINARYNPGH